MLVARLFSHHARVQMDEADQFVANISKEVVERLNYSQVVGGGKCITLKLMVSRVCAFTGLTARRCGQLTRLSSRRNTWGMVLVT